MHRTIECTATAWPGRNAQGKREGSVAMIPTRVHSGNHGVHFDIDAADALRTGRTIDSRQALASALTTLHTLLQPGCQPQSTPRP